MTVKKKMLEFKERNSEVCIWIFSSLIVSSILYNYLLLIVPISLTLLLLIKKNIYLKYTFLDLGFTIIFLSEICSTFFSIYPYNSLESNTNFFVVLCFYILFKNFLNNKSRNSFLLILVWISNLLIVLTLKEFIGHVQITNSLGFYELNNFKNFYSPFEIFNNEWASILLMILPVNLIQLIRTKSLEYKIVFAVFVLLNILCIIFSFSRGAYLSLILLVVVSFFGLWKYIGLKKVLALSTFLVFCSSLVIISVPQIKSSFLTTISFDKTISQQRSINGRLSSLNNVDNIIAETPVFGYGQNNYVLSTYRTPLVDEDARFSPRATNVIFQIIIERGLFGLLCYMLFFGILIFVVYRRLKNNILSYKKKAEQIILLSGVLALVFRELTFSSIFANNYVYFLFFILIILLSPNDISFKRKYNYKWIKSRRTFNYLFIGIFVFIAFLNVKRHYVKKFNNQYIEAFNKNKVEQSIKYIDRALSIDSDNIILNKHKAIAISKKAIKISMPKDSIAIFKVTVIDNNKLSELKAVLTNILNLNKYDDEIHHGLAWVNYVENNIECSNYHLKRAIKLNPHKGIYYFSRSLFQLDNNIDSIVEYSLGRTMQLNPEFLESKIYKILRQNKKSLILTAEELANNNLQSRTHNNVILKARLARLLLEKDSIKSKEFLEDVTVRLPNLPRPWLYLTYLKEFGKGKNRLNVELINRTLALNGNDYLTNLYFGNYYKGISDNTTAAYYYNNALIQYLELRSYDYMKNMFLSDLKTLKDTEIPGNINHFFFPDIQHSRIFSFLKTHYESNKFESQSLDLKLLSKEYRLKGFD